MSLRVPLDIGCQYASSAPSVSAVVLPVSLVVVLARVSGTPGRRARVRRRSATLLMV